MGLAFPGVEVDVADLVGGALVAAVGVQLQRHVGAAIGVVGAVDGGVAGGGLRRGATGSAVLAVGDGGGQVVLLLVEVAGGDVHAQVARDVVGRVAQRCGVGVGVVVQRIAVAALQHAGARGAEHEAGVGAGQRGGVGLLVVVAGGDVDPDVARGILDRAAHRGIVHRAEVADLVVVVLLRIHHQGRGSALVVRLRVGFRRVPATFVSGVGRYRQHCSHCQGQRGQDHSRFHGVSPCISVLSVGLVLAWQSHSMTLTLRVFID